MTIKIDIESTKFSVLALNTKKRLAKLSIKVGSVLRPWVAKSNPNSWVFIARNQNGRIVGWACAEPYGDISWDGYDVHVYVEPKFRHRGIAKLLLYRVVQKKRRLNRRRSNNIELDMPGDFEEDSVYRFGKNHKKLAQLR